MHVVLLFVTRTQPGYDTKRAVEMSNPRYLPRYTGEGSLLITGHYVRHDLNAVAFVTGWQSKRLVISPPCIR